MAIQLLLAACVGTNKISVLLLYKRIFVIPAFRKLVWCLIGVVICWTIAFEIALLCMSFWPVMVNQAEQLSSMCADRIAMGFRT